MHYSRNGTRIIPVDDIFYRQDFNELGYISPEQVFLPVQLLTTPLKSLHGTTSKHPGIPQKMQERRRKYHFQSAAKTVQKWVQQCKT